MWQVCYTRGRSVAHTADSGNPYFGLPSGGEFVVEKCANLGGCPAKQNNFDLLKSVAQTADLGNPYFGLPSVGEAVVERASI